ncbi:hypothetical protein [Christiangramia aquimixticola]|uniref:hypothetical protein n=1 Tax=Christiangramia aquimixticola TaxID=1697558 RepID=UPI003AA8EEAF
MLIRKNPVPASVEEHYRAMGRKSNLKIYIAIAIVIILTLIATTGVVYEIW